MDTQKNYFYSMNAALLVPSFLCSWPLAIITHSLYSGAPLLVAYCSVYMIFPLLFHSSLVELKIHISTLEVIAMESVAGEGLESVQHGPT
jgi:hypothetical protein